MHPLRRLHNSRCDTGQRRPAAGAAGGTAESPLVLSLAADLASDAQGAPNGNRILTGKSKAAQAGLRLL